MWPALHPPLLTHPAAIPYRRPASRPRTADLCLQRRHRITIPKSHRPQHQGLVRISAVLQRRECRLPRTRINQAFHLVQDLEPRGPHRAHLSPRLFMEDIRRRRGLTAQRPTKVNLLHRLRTRQRPFLSSHRHTRPRQLQLVRHPHIRPPSPTCLPLAGQLRYPRNQRGRPRVFRASPRRSAKTPFGGARRQQVGLVAPSRTRRHQHTPPRPISSLRLFRPMHFRDRTPWLRPKTKSPKQVPDKLCRPLCLDKVPNQFSKHTLGQPKPTPVRGLLHPVLQ
jgi:hypothetical protein